MADVAALATAVSEPSDVCMPDARTAAARYKGASLAAAGRREGPRPLKINLLARKECFRARLRAISPSRECATTFTDLMFVAAKTSAKSTT